MEPDLTPTRLKGEKRPADVIGNAVKAMRIVTDEETDPLPAPVRRALPLLSSVAAAAQRNLRRIEINRVARR
jgi:hypothetical protein